MLRFLPVLLIAAFALLQWRYSARRTKRELDVNSAPLDDPTLEAVAKRLGRAVDLPHLRANVVRMDAFNGLAAPDGRIFITSGVVDKYQRGEISANEVGSIIAHELGHVALGHSKRRMMDWTGQNAARVALSMVLNRVIPGLGVWIANGAISLLAAKLSRRDEFEADAYAAALMRRAGVDPSAQSSLLRKLETFAPTQGGAAWLMSHPPIASRVKAIDALHDSWDRETA
jgi:putative metalloprotease